MYSQSLIPFPGKRVNSTFTQAPVRRNPRQNLRLLPHVHVLTPQLPAILLLYNYSTGSDINRW